MSKVQTGNLFTDAEMALFGVAEPKAKRGRGLSPGKQDGYIAPAEARRKCVYSVKTQQGSICLSRDYTLPLFGVGTSGIRRGRLDVTVHADSTTRIGHQFASVVMQTRDGQWHVWTVDVLTLRNMAQVFNAAANSCGAEWRKSSILS